MAPGDRFTVTYRTDDKIAGDFVLSSHGRPVYVFHPGEGVGGRTTVDRVVDGKVFTHPAARIAPPGETIEVEHEFELPADVGSGPWRLCDGDERNCVTIQPR